MYLVVFLLSLGIVIIPFFLPFFNSRSNFVGKPSIISCTCIKVLVIIVINLNCIVRFYAFSQGTD